MEVMRALERAVRRLTTDAIWELRRSRRVIVPPEMRVACESPVFIIGVHRSGTTLVRLIVDSHPSIACPPESFFIAALGSLLEDPKAREGLLAMGFSEEHVLARLREFVSYFFESYAASRGRRRWADKTPSYIDCLDLIEALYGPGCRYIMVYRHGLDVACSAAKMEIREMEPYAVECGGDRLAGAARYWSVQCAKQLAFQDRHRERCMELRYEDLTREPEPRLRALFDFISEPWVPEVLRFHEHEHDHWIGLQDGKAADSRGIDRRSDNWRSRSASEIEAMLRQAGPMLDRLNYSSAVSLAPPIQGRG